ncbi:MAG: TonB family protein [Bacteroidota bacterium]
MPTASAPSSRTLFLSLAALVAVVATVLAACEQGGIQPPDGWEVVSENQWARPGVDPDDAFRDLSSVASMGVVDEADSDVIRYAKEQMLYLYRTSPEVVDSVFTAVAVPLLDRSFPREGFQAQVDAALNDAKIAMLGSRQNQAIYRQATPLPDPAPERAVYPDSLKSRGVSGEVAVQVRIDAEGQPVAVQVVESVHPTLDALVMRQAATTSFNPAWVVKGRSGGTAIPNYTRVRVPFE